MHLVGAGLALPPGRPKGCPYKAARDRLSLRPAGRFEDSVCDSHCRENSGNIMHTYDVGATQD